MKPVILFESYPDFSGSALEIYNELIKREYNKKYDLIWAVYSTFNEKTNYNVVKFHGCNTPEKRNILSRTKIIIDSNRYIQKPRPDVFRIHVRHGLTLKKCQSYYNDIGNLDAIITTSDEMLKIEENAYPSYLKNKFIITGMPTTDRLFHPNDLYNGFIQELTNNNIKYNKIISWLPTYREHRFSHFGKNKYEYGLTALHNKFECDKLNNVLKNNNILLIIQMHHAQAKNYQNLLKYSNIVVVNENIKSKYSITTSDILGNSDALITDYSGAYQEYIILNKPIGLIIEDLVDYSKNVGFYLNYLEWIKGDYLLDNTDLINWVNDIANNIDKSKNERIKSLNKTHLYQDDKSTQRVVDYIVNKTNL